MDSDFPSQHWYTAICRDVRTMRVNALLTVRGTVGRKHFVSGVVEGEMVLEADLSGPSDAINRVPTEVSPGGMN